MPPSYFEEFVCPWLKCVVQEAHKVGPCAFNRTDGNTEIVLDMIVDTGVYGLRLLEPTISMDTANVEGE